MTPFEQAVEILVERLGPGWRTGIEADLRTALPALLAPFEDLADRVASHTLAEGSEAQFRDWRNGAGGGWFDVEDEIRAAIAEVKGS